MTLFITLIHPPALLSFTETERGCAWVEGDPVIVIESSQIYGADELKLNIRPHKDSFSSYFISTYYQYDLNY